MYLENSCPPRWPWLLLVAFVLLVVPNLWLPELSREEAWLALNAQEMLQAGPSDERAYRAPDRLGALVPTWCLALAGKFLGFSEFVVRLPSALALLGLAALCAWAGLRAIGPQAAAVSAAAVISNCFVFRVGLNGEPDLMGALFLDAAWLGWYRLSRERKRWLYAWLVAHVFVLLAVLTIGLHAILYFYLPIVALRRPIKARRRLLKTEHLLSAAMLLMFVGLWIALSPSRETAVARFLESFHPEGTLGTYLQHIVTFPFLAAFFFMPWTFLVWPAFCVAFRPLEQAPVLGRYLRTIVVSLFLCFWFIPLPESTLAPLLGPLALLIGVNYDILVRRHGRKLELIPKVLAVVGLGFAAIIFVVGWMHKPPVVPRDPAVVVSAFLCLGLAAVGAYAVFSHHLHGPVWLHVIVGVLIIRLAALSSYTVYEAELGNQRKRDALTLVRQLPEDVPIYWLTEAPREIPVRIYYAKRAVYIIRSTEALPGKDDIVYLLASNNAPISEGRIWEQGSELVTLDGAALRMWRGQVNLLDVSPAEIAIGHVSGNEVNIATLTLRNTSNRQLSITELTSSDPGAFFVRGDLPVHLAPGASVQFDIHLNGDSGAIAQEDAHLLITLTSTASTLNRRVPVKLYKRP
jgi:4-amino-4-deoxy-L-arabinose transferase-like glycosyltransferase